MSPDFKTALARAHRSGALPFAPEALAWLLQGLHRSVPASGSSTQTGPQEMAQWISRQARQQFGGLAEAVLKHWGWLHGADLFRALQCLEDLGAARLSELDTLAAYAALGNLWPEAWGQALAATEDS